MFSFQSHNQVLYHLTQFTSAFSSRTKPLPFSRRKAKAGAESNISDPNTLCEESYLEALKSCNELLEMTRGTYKFEINNRNSLETLEQLIIKNITQSSENDNHWRISYKCGPTFEDNKRGYPYRFSPLCHLNQVVIYPQISQKRYFKTERTVRAELDRNPSVLIRLRKWLGLETETNKKFDNTAADKTIHNVLINNNIDIERLKKITDNKEIKADELQRIKAAFAEGYLVGHELKPKTRSMKVLKYIQQISYTFLIVMLVVLLATTGGSMFKIQIGNRTEVDPQETHVTFNDVKGVEEAKTELMDVVEFLKNPEKFSALGGKLPKGVLLVGPPGTGKTLLARAVAGEAGVPFFYAAGPEFDEILVGQGARRVRDLFKAAKDRAPCVIFIDEIDSVGSKRTNSALHPYANQTINQLLSEMDGFHQNEGVIVLGATNRQEDLDKALLRPGRFDLEITVNAPDYSGRKEILELYLSRILTRNIDVNTLAKATIGFTGADIENMINQAALRAAIDGAEYVTMTHLEKARDKVLMGPEGKKKIMDEEENRLTAYHEGGHALVAYYTKDAMPIHKVTIIPRGKSLGHTAYLKEKEVHNETKAEMLAMMDVAMGGRAAEELIFGADKVTSGAYSDFSQATWIAENMVKKYGMSEKVGFRVHQDSRTNSDGITYSPNTNELIDSEIKRLLQESYDRAKIILKTHRKEHKQLVDALLKYETLSAEEIKAIINGKKVRNEPSPSLTPPTLVDVPKNIM